MKERTNENNFIQYSLTSKISSIARLVLQFNKMKRHKREKLCRLFLYILCLILRLETLHCCIIQHRYLFIKCIQYILRSFFKTKFIISPSFSFQFKFLFCLTHTHRTYYFSLF